MYVESLEVGRTPLCKPCKLNFSILISGLIIINYSICTCLKDL